MMDLAWSDFNALASFDDELVILNLHGELAFGDEEELARVYVVVRGLGGAGRHGLFDDLEIGRFDEKPSVAVSVVRAAPLVVLGVGGVDCLCGHKKTIYETAYYFTAVKPSFVRFPCTAEDVSQSRKACASAFRSDFAMITAHCRITG